MNGIIIVDKEPGFTSMDVVACLRGVLKQKKMGHTGTLDPDATGVLPVCLGNATKLCDMLTDKKKVYEAEFLLGVQTDTQDTSGEVLKKAPVTCTPEEIRNAATGFLGEQDQIPPMYSAVKIDGVRLYDMARKGMEVERKPRRVTFYDIEVLKIDLPYVSIRVACSKGTYIRTLCNDIGEKLGCHASMSRLRRVGSGEFDISEAHTIDEIRSFMDSGRIGEILIPTDRAFPDAIRVRVKSEFKKLIENGNAFLPSDTVEHIEPAADTRARVYDEEGHFYGLYRFDGTMYRVVKMFLEQ